MKEHFLRSRWSACLNKNTFAVDCCARVEYVCRYGFAARCEEAVKPFRQNRFLDGWGLRPRGLAPKSEKSAAGGA